MRAQTTWTQIDTEEGREKREERWVLWGILWCQELPPDTGH
ncbi:MAG: hypothetical protein U9R01_02675 [candidate division WOR-3 bacterium]|nr:hypothetical protein [candidate division WOR-3 bacterium]